MDIHENFRSAITVFEVWCNDGYEWLVQKENDCTNKWHRAEDIVNPGKRASDKNGFDNVKKYRTNAQPGDWAEVFDF